MKLYYSLKVLFAALYACTWIASIKLFLIPLINLYGGWTFLGYFFGIFLAAAITSFAFLATPKPSKTGATKFKTHATINIPLNINTTDKEHTS